MKDILNCSAELFDLYVKKQSPMRNTREQSPLIHRSTTSPVKDNTFVHCFPLRDSESPTHKETNYVST